MPRPTLTDEQALAEIRRILCPDAPEGNECVVAAAAYLAARVEGAGRRWAAGLSGDRVMTYESGR